MSNTTRFTPSREILERALSHYLEPASPQSFTVHHDLSFEDALAQKNRGQTTFSAPSEE
ncbi:hypothetical protein [Pseudomonas sp. KBS0710]|uniref:hypothetical protein n=1 Tax=Pseudomonas sp. KBS0710 TaxID=1179667 RepID=UPI0015B4BFE6|nr:hypothetical protein [Pseudomonas sp. KBS0710]